MDEQLQSIAQQIGSPEVDQSTTTTDPDLSAIEGQIGKPESSQDTSSAVKSALNDLGDQSYNGWCQSFVEAARGTGKQGGTAFEAWQNNLNNRNAHPGIEGAKPGDAVYFTPTEQVPAGHTGLYLGDNKFVSATDNGVKVYNLNDWQKLTGQSILGYIK